MAKFRRRTCGITQHFHAGVQPKVEVVVSLHLLSQSGLRSYPHLPPGTMWNDEMVRSCRLYQTGAVSSESKVAAAEWIVTQVSAKFHPTRARRLPEPMKKAQR
jgi:hypothetical protein